MGAVIAALCSFAYAKAPSVPHGGGGGYSHGPANHAMRGEMHDGGNRRYGAAAAAVGSARSANAERGAHLPQGNPNFAGASYGNGFGVYNPGMRRVAGPSGYAADGRGGMQYAGAITPVSAESRTVPRPPATAPVRAGSIRADVARYNEERGAPRGMPRQADDPRPPEGSPYRN